MTSSNERTRVSASIDHRYDPSGSPRDRSLRVGDRERDAVGEILRERHLEGRLDTDEFQARLERCLTAKTYAELDELIADFPREEEERRVGQPRRRTPWPFVPFLPLALVAAIVIGAHGVWPVFPVFLFFLFVVRPLRWHGGYRRGRM
jgi:hypothetical protein